MKRKPWFYAIAFFLLLICIVAVRKFTVKTVPQEVLWGKIDAFIDEKFTPNIKQQLAPRYWSINYSFSVEHPRDFRIRTDAVHVKVLLEEEHFSASTEYDAEYTYDRNSKTWTASNEIWAPIRVIRYKNISTNSQDWADTFEYVFSQSRLYKITFGTDFREESPEYLNTALRVEGAVSGWGRFLVPNMHCYVLENEENAKTAFSNLLAQYKTDEFQFFTFTQFEPIRYYSGENYELYIASGVEDEIRDQYGYFIRVDNTIISLCINGEKEDYTGYYAREKKLIDECFAHMGFYIPEPEIQES